MNIRHAVQQLYNYFSITIPRTGALYRWSRTAVRKARRRRHGLEHRTTTNLHRGNAKNNSFSPNRIVRWHWTRWTCTRPPLSVSCRTVHQRWRSSWNPSLSHMPSVPWTNRATYSNNTPCVAFIRRLLGVNISSVVQNRTRSFPSACMLVFFFFFFSFRLVVHGTRSHIAVCVSKHSADLSATSERRSDPFTPRQRLQSGRRGEASSWASSLSISSCRTANPVALSIGSGCVLSTSLCRSDAALTDRCCHSGL